MVFSEGEMRKKNRGVDAQHAGQKPVTIWLPEQLAQDLDSKLAAAAAPGLRPSRSGFIVHAIQLALHGTADATYAPTPVVAAAQPEETSVALTKSIPSVQPTKDISLKILTERQRIVLDFIIKGSEKGRIPTFREIGDHIGIRSIANIKYYIKILKEKGCLNMAEAVPLIQGVSYYRRRHLGHESLFVPEQSKQTLITEGRKNELKARATPAGIYTKDGQLAKPKHKTNLHLSTRSIAAELISIFEKGSENDNQGENNSSDSRDGEEMVRGAGQEQTD